MNRRIVVFAIGLLVACLPAARANIAALLGGAPPTASAPTMSSAAVASDGRSVTINWSVSCSIGAGGSGGFTLTPTAGAMGELSGTDSPTLTYSSGAPGTSWTFAVGARILNKTDVETFTVTYTQPGNGVEATTGGADVASYGPTAITNNSTVVSHLQRYAQETTNDSERGIGWNGNNVASRGTGFTATFSGPITRVDWYVEANGGAETIDQPIYAYMTVGVSATAVGVPNATIGPASTARSTNTIPTAEAPDWRSWQWDTLTAGQNAVTNGNRYIPVLYTAIIATGTLRYVAINAATTGRPDDELYTKLTNPPASSGDAANWTVEDTDGALMFRVFTSPGNDNP